MRPLLTRLVSEKKPLSAGVSYEIACEVIGSRPPPIISWWKGDIQLRNSKEKITSDGNSTTSVLVIVPAVDDLGKYLSCKASNSLIPGSLLEDGWKLDIYHVPQVSLELGRNLNSTVIKEGMDVYFECNVRANPWVSRIAWKHNGNPVLNNPNKGIILTNQSLVLQSIGRTRAGKYSCIASNREGDGESNFIKLDIMYVPICRPGQEQTVGVGKGELAKIVCRIEAEPAATDFIWRFNNTGESVEIPRNHFTAEPNLSQVTYTPLTEQDFGTVLCWAQNSMGLMKRPCVYHVVPAGKPDSLNNCSLMNQSEVSLGVECNEGFDGGMLQQFVMEVYETEGDQRKRLVANVTAMLPQLTVTGLAPAQSFQILVYAFNDKGKGAITVINTHTLKYPEKRTADDPLVLDTIHMVAILSGILLTLILMSTCVLVAVTCRTKRNLKQFPSSSHENKEETIQRSTDSLENNPDIIPNSTEFQDTFSQRNAAKPSKINFKGTQSESSVFHQRDEVSYVSVGIGTTCCDYLEIVPPPILQPTVYAQVDGRNHLYLHHTAV